MPVFAWTNISLSTPISLEDRSMRSLRRLSRRRPRARSGRVRNCVHFLIGFGLSSIDSTAEILIIIELPASGEAGHSAVISIC